MNQCACCDIVHVDTELTMKDHIGALKVRFGVGRSNYKVSPGLYAVGEPDGDSPILVSANYKLTFDSLRKELAGMDCYLLILDTKGINVWCAAGKGTFGTDELVRRIESTGLKDITKNRTLILPQLAAPGISAHDVKERSGFSVVYGPVRASDLKEFVEAGMKATDEMREMRFTIRDRIVLVPMEFIPAMKILFLIFGLLFIVNIVAERPFGYDDLILFMCTVVAGTVLTPILLPFIPVRAFSLKGWVLGALLITYVLWSLGWFQDDVITAAGYLFLLPSVSAYFAMNFTGSSTYTSFSGVIKEMRIAVPLIVVTIVIGAVLLFAGRVI